MSLKVIPFPRVIFLSIRIPKPRLNPEAGFSLDIFVLKAFRSTTPILISFVPGSISFGFNKRPRSIAAPLFVASFFSAFKSFRLAPIRSPKGIFSKLPFIFFPQPSPIVVSSIPFLLMVSSLTSTTSSCKPNNPHVPPARNVAG